MAPRRLVRSVYVGAFVTVASASASAQRPDVDGVYGRFRGDLTLSVEGNGGYALAGDGAAVVGGAVRARVLDMTGVVVGYDRALSAGRWDALWAGVDFRPAMLARWSYDYERGPRWVDLMVDSLGVEVGAAWVRPGDGQRSGAGFVVGTGVELPLVWSEARGLTLRLAARRYVATRWDAGGTGEDDGAWTFTAGLVLRTIVRSGLIGGR